MSCERAVLAGTGYQRFNRNTPIERFEVDAVSEADEDILLFAYNESIATTILSTSLTDSGLRSE